MPFWLNVLCLVICIMSFIFAGVIMWTMSFIREEAVPLRLSALYMWIIGAALIVWSIVGAQAGLLG